MKIKQTCHWCGKKRTNKNTKQWVHIVWNWPMNGKADHYCSETCAQLEDRRRYPNAPISSELLALEGSRA